MSAIAEARPQLMWLLFRVYLPFAGGYFMSYLYRTVNAVVGPVIAEDARQKIAALPSVATAKVHIVWDPQWTPQMISAEGRVALGLE